MSANLLVVWGLFFIAAKKDPSPTLKGRNFKKSAKIAKEIAAKTIGSPRSSSVGRRAKVEPGCDAEQGNANIISGIDNQVLPLLARGTAHGVYSS